MAVSKKTPATKAVAEAVTAPVKAAAKRVTVKRGDLATPVIYKSTGGWDKAAFVINVREGNLRDLQVTNYQGKSYVRTSVAQDTKGETSGSWR